jgi:hypothetical protein
MNKSLPSSRLSSSRLTPTAAEPNSDHVTPDEREGAASVMKECENDNDNNNENDCGERQIFETSHKEVLC